MRRLQQLIEHRLFAFGIIALILINAVTLGMETSASIMADYGVLLRGADRVILICFTIELILKGTSMHGICSLREPKCRLARRPAQTMAQVLVKRGNDAKRHFVRAHPINIMRKLGLTGRFDLCVGLTYPATSRFSPSRLDLKTSSKPERVCHA